MPVRSVGALLGARIAGSLGLLRLGAPYGMHRLSGHRCTHRRVKSSIPVRIDRGGRLGSRDRCKVGGTGHQILLVSEFGMYRISQGLHLVKLLCEMSRSDRKGNLAKGLVLVIKFPLTSTT